MRTNIVMDNGLIRKAMKATGLSTERAVVEEDYGCSSRQKDKKDWPTAWKVIFV